jgi:bifunctional DNase/RNase
MEASAIHSELMGKKYQRPLTHDLLVTIIDSLKGKISRVVITDLKDSTFFASIYLDAGAGAVAIDARPSDSIAIALRSHAPIFIVDKLFEKSMEPQAMGSPPEKSPEEKAEELRHFLEELRPEDFGKWNPEDT